MLSQTLNYSLKKTLEKLPPEKRRPYLQCMKERFKARVEQNLYLKTFADHDDCDQDDSPEQSPLYLCGGIQEIYSPTPSEPDLKKGP